MILPLLKRELKSNFIILLIFMGVLTMYAAMIVSMFDPSMGESLDMLAESMPEIFAAVGMLNATDTLLQFITNYLYGMLFIVFPAVFVIILANRLVAKYVDNGSMAYLLAAPQSRRKIVFTQALFLLLNLLILAGYLVGLIIMVSAALFPGELDVALFVKVNAGWFGVLVFWGGICFLFSCLANESRYALGLSSAVVVYSILVQMVAQVGEKFENLKYATPLTLFDVQGLVEGEAMAAAGCVILYVVGIACAVMGGIYFTRKDLPI